MSFINFITDIVLKVGDYDKMDDDSNEDLFERRDVRKKKDKKRQHKSSKMREETNRDNFKRMKDELDELKKRELERTKELDELKKKILDKEMSQQSMEDEYEFGFDKNAYLSKGFIESAQWVQNTLAKQMLEKMNEAEYKEKFSALLLSKNVSTHLGYRACARFNRNEECNLGKWHMTHKLDGVWTTHGINRHRGHQHDQSGQSGQFGSVQHNRRNEIRLHVCTLCLEAFGAAFGHRVPECPWILKKNWEI